MGGRSSKFLAHGFVLVLAAQVAMSLVACGGTVRKGDDGQEEEDEPPPTPSASPSGGGRGTAPQVDLPECKLGVDESEAESCLFLYEGRCYEEKLDACACACKRMSGTTCSSGFPDPSRPTKVSCY